MRQTWNAIAILLLINAILMVGVVGYLTASGRLSRERIGAAAEVFRTTVAEEQAELEQAAALEEQARQQAAEMARLERAGDGPITLAQRLENEQVRAELIDQRSERWRREQEDLLRQLNLAQQLLAKERAELDAERQAFDEVIERETAQRQSEDFQQAVRMYEQLKPRQVKQMFQTLMAQNQTEQVVEYLSAMQLRKAAAVLKEFKEDPEIPQAAELIERLRQRGVDVTAMLHPQPIADEVAG